MDSTTMIALTYLSWATAGISPLVPLLTKLLTRSPLREVGGDRIDPLAAALLSYAGWCANSLIKCWGEEHFSEGVYINGFGAICYLLYLAAFVACQDSWRAIPFQRLCTALLYLVCTILTGRLDLHDDYNLYDVFYSLAGIAAAAVPLIVVVFSAERDVEKLPYPAAWGFGILNNLVWITRGRLIANPYIMIQNAVAVPLSMYYPFLYLMWSGRRNPPGIDNSPLIQQEPPVAPQQHAPSSPARSGSDKAKDSSSSGSSISSAGAKSTQPEGEPSQQAEGADAAKEVEAQLQSKAPEAQLQSKAPEEAVKSEAESTQPEVPGPAEEPSTTELGVQQAEGVVDADAAQEVEAQQQSQAPEEAVKSEAAEPPPPLLAPRRRSTRIAGFSPSPPPPPPRRSDRIRQQQEQHQSS